jgi:hypothetical protein
MLSAAWNVDISDLFEIELQYFMSGLARRLLARPPNATKFRRRCGFETRLSFELQLDKT